MIKSVIDLLQLSDVQLQKVEFFRPGEGHVEALCTKQTPLSPVIDALTVKRVKIPVSTKFGISLRCIPAHQVSGDTVYFLVEGKGRVVVESADGAPATFYHLASTHPVVVPSGRTHAMMFNTYTVFVVITVAPSPVVEWEGGADKMLSNEHLS